MKKLVLLTLAFALCLTARAQGVSFGVATSAAAVRSNGNTIPVADAKESLSFISSPKLGMFYLDAHQITSTDQTLNAYLFGGQWTPKIDGLLSKTLLPANTFQLSVHADPGFVRNSLGKTHIGGIAGGSLDYAPNSDGHFAVNVVSFDYTNFSGLGKSRNGYMVRSGVSLYFGGTK